MCFVGKGGDRAEFGTVEDCSFWERDDLEFEKLRQGNNEKNEFCVLFLKRRKIRGGN